MTKLFNKLPHKQLRRRLRQEMPKGEKLLWSKLRNRQLNFKFKRQYGVDNYVIDFYCPECKLGIEVDGLTHEDRKSQDKFRQNYIESLGIKIIRFRSDEVIYDLDRVLTQIYHTCSELSSTSP